MEQPISMVRPSTSGIQSDHVRAEDFITITKEKVGGTLSGNVTLTSLNPIKVNGPSAR